LLRRTGDPLARSPAPAETPFSRPIPLRIAKSAVFGRLGG